MSDIQQSPPTPPDPSGPEWAPGPQPPRRRRRVGTVALVAGGLVAGGVLGGTLSATASNGDSVATGVSAAAQAGAPGVRSGEGYGTPSSGQGGEALTPPSSEATDQGGRPDESQSQRSDETLLTGETAEKVEAAALATYPGATILRVETDSDGVYEAHLVTADGRRVTVAVGEDFTVTGVEEMGAGGPGGHGGRGPGRGDDGDGTTSPGAPAAPDAQAPSNGFSSPDSSGGTSGQPSRLSS